MPTEIWKHHDSLLGYFILLGSECGSVEVVGTLGCGPDGGPGGWLCPQKREWIVFPVSGLVLKRANQVPPRVSLLLLCHV